MSVTDKIPQKLSNSSDVVSSSAQSRQLAYQNSTKSMILCTKARLQEDTWLIPQSKGIIMRETGDWALREDKKMTLVEG